MAKRQSKSKPTWANVKLKLAEFDRTALLSLVQNLYAVHKENQAFLHALCLLKTSRAREIKDLERP